MAIIDMRGNIRTRGPDVGYCNICDSYGKLTNDHVPPKGALRIRQVDLLHIVELLDAERPISKKNRRVMQNGVTFRSLCSTCNTRILGVHYDPYLVDFCNNLATVLTSSITLPAIVSVPINPGAVARSVLGHMFAIGIERREKTELQRRAANFFLDSTAPLPDGINIFCWPYPYRRQVQIRDAVLQPDFFASPSISFWCLKFFPVAFMVTWENDGRSYREIPNLRNYMLQSGNFGTRINIPLTRLPRQDWPEAPNDNSAVFYGDAAVGALPRPS